jgi:aryl-alcohol dehydrogenase-like predicted oxidoreductase
VLSRADGIVPISGTRNTKHPDENIAAACLKVDPEILAAVDEIFRPGAVAGARYSFSAQTQIDTELTPEEHA